MGRKRTIDREEVFKEIIERICEGETISEILSKQTRKEGYPAFSTWFEWLEEDEQKAERYARARAIQIEREVDEIKKIADSELFIEEEEYQADEKGKLKKVKVTKKANYQQKQQMIDARKWRAGKISQGKYGNNAKVDLNKTNRVSIELNLGSDEEDEIED